MSGESHYLDAIEAEENGEIDDALEHARLAVKADPGHCLLYTSPSPRDLSTSRMPSSA